MHSMANSAKTPRRRFIVWKGTHQAERTQLWTRMVTLPGLPIMNALRDRHTYYHTWLVRLRLSLAYICFHVWMILPIIAIRILCSLPVGFPRPKNQGNGVI